MKRDWLPWIVLLGVILWVAAAARPEKSLHDGFDLREFSKLPVLASGRIKPLDSVAENSLLIAKGKQTLKLEDGKKITARQWLADVLLHPEIADDLPSFTIQNSEVLGLFQQQMQERKSYSFNELSPALAKIDEEGRAAEALESAQRTPYQTAVLNLRNALMHYQQLKNSLQPSDARDFSGEIAIFEQALPAGLAAISQRQRGEEFDQAAFDRLAPFVSRYDRLSTFSYIAPIPPVETGKQWVPLGEGLLGALATGSVDPMAKAYAALGDLYRTGDAEGFNRRVREIAQWMQDNEPAAARDAAYETFFNDARPFYHSMSLYLVAFLLVCFSWLWAPRTLGRIAFWILVFSFCIHTFGLGSRMVLQDRPPVTNLYSSAIFIGWGTIILGIILERLHRNGIGTACSAMVGFITLIIAHHLAASGDTLEMMRAVLDSNVWLATHVVVITAGYSAMFLAGALAAFYIVLGFFTPVLDRAMAQSMSRMVYGIICFATLFSFVGTVLGGIWADQSWGRFWGWDPKENGALLIVLWCAIVLHARWGGYARQRGIMVMALFGNIVTAFSWFGVNMLGVGLHSYGFMDKAEAWLIAFVSSQLLLMAIGSLPPAWWRSADGLPAPRRSEAEPAVV